MIITRMLRAIPYVLGAALVGALWFAFCGFPIVIGAALCSGLVSILIGRDIWKERHVWNDLERRFGASGLNIHDHL